MIYTSLRVMFLMRADTLCGQVEGGWALEIVSFLGPIEPIGECHLGPIKHYARGRINHRCINS
jgi:hypothetical protein